VAVGVGDQVAWRRTDVVSQGPDGSAAVAARLRVSARPRGTRRRTRAWRWRNRNAWDACTHPRIVGIGASRSPQRLTRWASAGLERTDDGRSRTDGLRRGLCCFFVGSRGRAGGSGVEDSIEEGHR
jgi:hypothetical protein